MIERNVLRNQPEEAESIITYAQQGKEDAWRELVTRYTKVIWKATESMQILVENGKVPRINFS